MLLNNFDKTWIWIEVILLLMLKNFTKILDLIYYFTFAESFEQPIATKIVLSERWRIRLKPLLHRLFTINRSGPAL